MIPTVVVVTYVIAECPYAGQALCNGLTLFTLTGN